MNIPPIQYDEFADIELTKETLDAMRRYGRRCVEANAKAFKNTLSLDEQAEVILRALGQETSTDPDKERSEAQVATDLARRLSTMGYAVVKTN